MSDTRDRLPPVSSTTRELWVFSGNQCAFRDCSEVLLDSDGHWNCEVAHIHGVKPGSARGDHKLSNEQLRQPSNLVLMCPNHHNKIDDKDLEATYTVEFVQKMKAEHEEKYRTAMRGLDKIIDRTAAHTVKRPVNLVGLLGCDTEDSVRQNLENAEPFIDALAKLPAPLRDVISLILNHADDPGPKNKGPITAGINFLHAAVSNDLHDLDGRLGELQAKGLLDLDRGWDDRPTATLIDPTAQIMGWDLFSSLYTFAQQSADPRAVIGAVIDELDFTVLDDDPDRMTPVPKNVARRARGR